MPTTITRTKKINFTTKMLQKGDILINRNGDVKEWRINPVTNEGYLYETFNAYLRHGRGDNKDLITNQINSHLKQSEGFKMYDIISVNRQGIITLINQK